MNMETAAGQLAAFAEPTGLEICPARAGRAGLLRPAAAKHSVSRGLMANAEGRAGCDTREAVAAE